MLSIIVLLAMTSFTIAQVKKELKPKQFVSTVHMKGKADFIYYALSEKTKTTIEVEGPGKLTVYNRARLEKNEQASQPYYLKYLLNNKLVISKKIGPQDKSTKVRYKNKLPGVPTKAVKEVIKIPPGKHKISFFKHKAKHKAHVRFVYEKTKKTHWKELTSKDNDPIKIQYLKSKKQQQYFRVNNKEGFLFSTNNNKKLRVFLRADFDYKMHNENIIRFILKRDGKPIKTYKVTCKKSNAVENISNQKLIPGNLEKIFIDLKDSGAHRYEIILKDPKKSAMIRVFVDDKEKATTKPTI